MISMESGKKQARDELKIMIRVMFEHALERQKEIDVAKKKGCKKGK
jgi:hypothetical protein